MKPAAFVVTCAIASCLAPTNGFATTAGYGPAVAFHRAPRPRTPDGQAVRTQRLPIGACRGTVAAAASVRRMNAAAADDAGNGSVDDGKEEDPDQDKPDVEASVVVTDEIVDGPLFVRLRKRFFPPSSDDGLTTRQRLAKMGLSALMSYGCVSNVTSALTVTLSWFVFSKRTGASPLAPGQWKGFLAVYAGFYLVNNIMRPIRVALAIAITPAFDRIVAAVQKRLNVKKGVAIGVTVFLVNALGTTTLLLTGVSLASMASGVPIWAK